MLRKLLPLTIVCAALGAGTQAEPVFSAAKRLITGAQVRDASLTGKDVKDGTLRLNDLARADRAALRGTAASSSAGAAGPAGARGPAGPAGPAGAKGDRGPKGDTGTVDTSQFYDKAASDLRFGRSMVESWAKVVTGNHDETLLELPGLGRLHVVCKPVDRSVRFFLKTPAGVGVTLYRIGDGAGGHAGGGHGADLDLTGSTGDGRRMATVMVTGSTVAQPDGSYRMASGRSSATLNLGWAYSTEGATAGWCDADVVAQVVTKG